MQSSIDGLMKIGEEVRFTSKCFPYILRMLKQSFFGSFMTRIPRIHNFSQNIRGMLFLMREVGISLVQCEGGLIEVSSHTDAVEYINILENVMLPSVQNIYSSRSTDSSISQDNSTIHTAHIVWQWFVQHPEIVVLNCDQLNLRHTYLNLIGNVEKFKLHIFKLRN